MAAQWCNLLPLNGILKKINWYILSYVNQVKKNVTSPCTPSRITLGRSYLPPAKVTLQHMPGLTANTALIYKKLSCFKLLVIKLLVLQSERQYLRHLLLNKVKTVWQAFNKHSVDKWINWFLGPIPDLLNENPGIFRWWFIKTEDLAS